MTEIDRYAVFGNPIKHSKSPRIHSLFAEETDQQLSYRAHLVEVGKFEAVSRSFFDNGGMGINVTVPFKLDAFNFADQLSERARLAGAVNTLAVQEDGSIYGDNTDGVGLVRDLHYNLGWELHHKRILILGAGGAVRGIIGPLLKDNPESITIANRTVSKAEQLAKDFKKLGQLKAIGYDELAGHCFDIIINGTSAGLNNEMPDLPAEILSDDACCYDMVYGAEPTPFMRWAAANTAWAVSDGLGMLVEQAAESFCIWRGVRPKTRPVIELLREELG